MRDIIRREETSQTEVERYRLRVESKFVTYLITMI